MPRLPARLSADPAEGGPRVLLDACVLVRAAARESLFAFAREGLFQPFWSPIIEAEWRSALAKPGAHALDTAMVEGDIALARLAFPGAVIGETEDLTRRAAMLDLPDRHDRHVLAAAILGGAETLVTDNLRDFPRRALAAHGLEGRAADPFLAELAEHAPAARAARAFAALAAGGAEPGPAAGLPARLKAARLPRFAKAVARRLAAEAADRPPD